MELKSDEMLLKQNIDLSWWEKNVLKSRYNEDLKNGFFTSPNVIDKIWLSSSDKLIQKLYKKLLDNVLQTETIKTSMKAWMKEIGHSIEIDQWLKTWKALKYMRVTQG